MRHDPRRLDVAAYPFTIELDTRFSDMDINFHLNNVAVARLYEECRVRFNWYMREHMDVGRPRFLVARAAIDYLAEGKYPAKVTVGFSVLSFGRTSYVAALGLFQSGACIGLCDTVMVHRDDTGPAPFPDALRAVLGDFMLRP